MDAVFFEIISCWDFGHFMVAMPSENELQLTKSVSKFIVPKVNEIVSTIKTASTYDRFLDSKMISLQSP
jgi:hypothetical protein